MSETRQTIWGMPDQRVEKIRTFLVDHSYVMLLDQHDNYHRIEALADRAVFDGVVVAPCPRVR